MGTDNAYNLIPGTDLNVSKVCLGTWLFGGRRWGPVDDDDSRRTIDAALDAGINFFDCADAYGEGKAEELLGTALRGKRERAILATKCGVVWNADGTRYHDLSAKHIQAACEASLRRLQIERIDLYHLHEMETGRDPRETAEALASLIEQGKIRYAAVSNYTVDVIKELRKYVPIVCTQTEYNLIKREEEAELIPYCKEAQLGFTAYSPLYRGILTGKFDAQSRFAADDNRSGDEEFQGQRFLDNLKKVEILKEIAEEHSVTAGHVAIQWLLAQGFVQSVICGARTPEQILDNVRALEVTLSPADIQKLDQTFQTR